MQPVVVPGGAARPGLWFEHLFTANVEMIEGESQEVQGQAWTVCHLQKIGRDRSVHAKLQAMNLGPVRGTQQAGAVSASSETFSLSNENGERATAKGGLLTGSVKVSRLP